MVQVEIVNPNQRVRLKKVNSSPYVPKKQLARELGRSPMTVANWETLLIRYVKDFRDYYKPKQPWNLYQVWCLERINEYWESLPRMDSVWALQEYIQANANALTQEAYFNELATTIRTESNINSARTIQAA